MDAPAPCRHVAFQTKEQTTMNLTTIPQDTTGGTDARPMPAPVPLTKAEERAKELAATIDLAGERLAAQFAEGHTVGFLATVAFYARFHRY
jgi:hypothetical protein